MGQETGFSLLELMIVVTVAGILLAIGVPSLVSITQNNRMLAVTNDFVSAVHAARMEAIKRRATVVVCGSTGATDVVPACAADLSAGWIVFVDHNANGVVNPDPDPALDDKVLVSMRLDTTRITLTGNGGNYFAFAPSGFIRQLPGVGPRLTSIKICDERGNVETTQDQSAARIVVLAGTGRPEVLKTLDSVTAYGGC